MQTQILKISEQEGDFFISKFMGYDYRSVNNEIWKINHHCLHNYSEDWRLLMPVIKKLNGGRPHTSILWEDITKALIDCDIERTWAAVVNYINWFYHKKNNE